MALLSISIADLRNVTGGQAASQSDWDTATDDGLRVGSLIGAAAIRDEVCSKGHEASKGCARATDAYRQLANGLIKK